ncbi:hypothetical protein SPLA10_PHROGS00088 [Salmonella phage SPLA10]|nr:hypothetical protein SPLA10_PHROGS00088 [Salmonella phage SPLA10]
MTTKVKQVATIANLIEIGKRVMLRQKSEAIQIPIKDYDPGTDLGERVSEDLGAGLLKAIKEKEAKEGVINAQ